jgi:hypothetical protein
MGAELGRTHPVPLYEGLALILAYHPGSYWGRHIPPRGFRDAQEVALARRVSVYRLRCLLGHQHLDGG